MFSDEDFVKFSRLILPGIIVLLFIYRWVHFRLFRKNYPKDVIRFRPLFPYPQRELYATGSSSKRIFMTNSNRLLYLLFLLLGVFAMILVIPLLA